MGHYTLSSRFLLLIRAIMGHMDRHPLGLSIEELRVLAKLTNPRLIQDYLDTLAINFEKRGETCMSPRRVLETQKAHCMEGALVAATCLMLAGKRPLLLDLKTTGGDDDHVVTLFKENGHWGAISKTNHATLRYRDPVYRTVRELAMSYFHEYFLNASGKKTLVSYSRPFSLARFGTSWITSREDLWHIPNALDRAVHTPIAPRTTLAHTREASAIERTAGKLVEWERRDART